jgi:hypothetical protein
VSLASFDDLEPEKSEEKLSINVLLYGKLTLGTGNQITMMRYKHLMNGEEIDGKKVKVYTKHICDGENEINEVQNFI